MTILSKTDMNPKSSIIEQLAMPVLESTDGLEFDRVLIEITNRSSPLCVRKDTSISPDESERHPGKLPPANRQS